MRPLPLIAALLLSAAAHDARSAQDRAEAPPSGSLAGWHGQPNIDPRKLAAMPEAERARQVEARTEDARKHWSVQDGDLVNDGHGAYLSTDKDYGDVELLIDYKTVAKADSGVYLRGTPQVQIWDSTREGGNLPMGGAKGSGGLWNNSAGAPGKDPLVLADKPFGEWNKLKILQVGSRTTVHLNGKLVVDHAIMENYWDRSLPIVARGPIQLQTHGGEIRWQNIFLREIPAAEANKILGSKGAEGFAPIFDGKSLEGWAGPIDNYDVIDGAIVCKPGKGGSIYRKKELTDFVARGEFRLPPGGNNGLAIRYPGEGDPAYAGMTELQVLDDSPKYTKIDPRQTHGSAYGIVASKPGYLRPVGDWNFQEVTVKGSKVKVELNGTVILDADLAAVTDYMAGSPHPGKSRTSGFFGLAGHNDPVAFRNLSIKPLD